MTTRWITLIRHAKSSWDQPQLTDKQRPLAKRGINNALQMGENHAALLGQIEQFYCSTGQRAMQTLELIARAAAIDTNEFSFSDELYTFDCRQLIGFCECLDDQYKSIAMVGHNPGLTEFINQLTDDHLYNMPTAAIARLRIKAEHWRQLSQSRVKLVYFSCPKNY